MPSCIVKGCTHYTGMKSSNPLLTMHVFPRELSRIKLWLEQIGQNFGDFDTFAGKVLDAARTGKYRICSAHFAPGSYTSQGSRIVLKHDAIPTLFPGIHPRPPPDKKQSPAPDKKPDTTDKGDNMDATAPKSTTQKKEAGPQANVDAHKRLQEGARRSQGHRQTPGPPREQLLDVNGRYTGVVNKGPGQKDVKTKTHELGSNWSIPLPADTGVENRRALWSLENLMVSLLRHLADAPQASRSKKQKTGRLLNQTAEIISMLTGEEWSVVKKNSHISKFYNMIREVPIKCGDVAVFFSMDEWDYIEDHEEHYKHVMVEEPKSLQLNGGSDEMKTDFFVDAQCEPRPNFGDIDFGEHLDFFESPVTFPPLTDKEETVRTEVEVLDMTCVSEDVIEEQTPDPPESTRIDSSSGDKDVGRQDVSRTPVSSTPATDKHKAKRKKDEDIVAVHRSTDVVMGPEPDTPERTDPASEAAVEESLECSELWIAQDGTTSSTWIPQDDPRPKGRNCSRYGKNAGRIQCPVSLSGITLCLPELPLKRAEAALDPHCDLCDLSFPNHYELDLHQFTHSKKQRL